MKLVVHNQTPTVESGNNPTLQDRLLTMAARVVPDNQWNYYPVPLAQKKADRALFDRCKAEIER